MSSVAKPDFYYFFPNTTGCPIYGSDWNQKALRWHDVKNEWYVYPSRLTQDQKISRQVTLSVCITPSTGKFGDEVWKTITVKIPYQVPLHT